MKDVSFSVKRGEILGIAGIIGSGQIELLEAVMGIRPSESGTVLLHGRDISALRPASAMRAEWRLYQGTGTVTV